MTGDGTNTYVWDGEHRLLQINYPGSGNNTQFSYDPMGRCSRSLRPVSSSVTSTKQFIGCGNARCEVRDSGGTTVLAQFFPRGETISGTGYFFAGDHPGSIREMTDGSGNVQAELSYDAYGRMIQLRTLTPDFGYAGMYVHQRSGLNLTATRAYSAGLGRFISRDPIGEDGGVNLYGYVGGSNYRN